MKKYLKTLLADIENAKNNRSPVRLVDEDEILPFELDDFYDENVEDSTESETKTQEETPRKSRNIREIMGLEREQFPPMEYWNEEEASQLVVALNDLLAHYNLAADYPTDLPPLMAYSTLVGALEKYAPIMPFGEWHLEFCNYEPSECPFGELYCSCKKSSYYTATENKKEDDDNFYDAFDNPNNIRGIHNYCDAWCERCLFNDRCAISRINQPFDDEKQDRFEIGSWQDDNALLQNTQKWLKAQLKESVKTLIEPLDEERQIFDKEANEVHRDVDSVALIQLSERYQLNVINWLKEDSIKPLLEMVESASENQNITDTDKILVESLMVIQWYVFFIYVKCVRAIKSKIDDDNIISNAADNFPKDSDGSSKIAVIGAERSLIAWYQFLVLKPLHKPFAIKMMALLDAIIQEGEAEFPNMRNFIRPGFDEKL